MYKKFYLQVYLLSINLWNMEEYQNEGLNIIAEKYPDIDFSDVDGKNVALVGAICKKLGINIIFANLPNGHAGFYDHQTNTIMVNDEQPATRNLFTVAHELGHYILHKGTNNRYDKYHKYTPEEIKREFEANDFAAKLLMPEYKFVEEFQRQNGNLLQLQKIFGVSLDAIKYRAMNLSLLRIEYGN
jgi:Zn-dependent peptidase ImmA (M78 family)